MPFMTQPFVDQLFVPVIVRFFFVFGIIGFVVGLGLIVEPVRMHRFFGLANTWVSLRRSTKWLAVPRDISSTVQRYRHLIGLTFILLGAFSTVVLMTQIDVDRVVATLHVAAPYAFVAWIVDSMRWFLIAGNVLAIAIGFMLMVFPGFLHSVETRVDRWVSFRAHSLGADTENMGLDRWVESYPRFAGWLIAIVTLPVVAIYGLRLFAQR